MRYDEEGVALSSVLAVPLRNGLMRPGAVRGTGIKMVNMGELFAHRRIGEGVEMERVPVGDKEAEKDLLAKDDILFARQSLVAEGAGQVSLFLGADEPVTFESHIIRVRVDPTKADPRFVFYFFESPRGRAAIWAIVDQTSAAGIRGRDLRRVHLPPLGLRAQARVAKALDALDRKGEAAQATADRLQAILDAEYDARFIRFVDQDAAAGTQSRPHKGWHRVSLSELAAPIRQSGKPGREPNRLFRHYSIPAFDATGRPEEVPGASMLSAKNVITGRHCLLVSKLNPETKRVWRVHEDGAMEAVASPEFVALAPKNGIPIAFIEGLLRNDDDFYDRLVGRVGGTTTSRQRLKPADILAAECLLPPADELERWDAFASPISDRILLARSQVGLVERIRHTLLSRFPWSVDEGSADETSKLVTAEVD